MFRRQTPSHHWFPQNIDDTLVVLKMLLGPKSCEAHITGSHSCHITGSGLHRSPHHWFWFKTSKSRAPSFLSHPTSLVSTKTSRLNNLTLVTSLVPRVTSLVHRETHHWLILRVAVQRTNELNAARGKEEQKRSRLNDSPQPAAPHVHYVHEVGRRHRDRE